MNKKNYIKPETYVMAMTEQVNILAGSGITQGKFSDEEAEDGIAWGAQNNNIWDDDDEE